MTDNVFFKNGKVVGSDSSDYNGSDYDEVHMIHGLPEKTSLLGLSYSQVISLTRSRPSREGRRPVRA